MSRKKNKKHRGPPRVAGSSVNLEEIAAIVERTKAALSAEEHAKLKAAMDTLASSLSILTDVIAQLHSKEISVERLRRMLFGEKTEKTEKVLTQAPASRYVHDREAWRAAWVDPRVYRIEPLLWCWMRHSDLLGSSVRGCGRTLGLSPQERLDLHRQESAPRMQALEEWMQGQFKQRLVEPNSTLGEAIRYMQGHWDALTLFLRKEGAPLDNNIHYTAGTAAPLVRKAKSMCSRSRQHECGSREWPPWGLACMPVVLGSGISS